MIQAISHNFETLYNVSAIETVHEWMSSLRVLNILIIHDARFGDLIPYLAQNNELIFVVV